MIILKKLLLVIVAVIGLLGAAQGSVGGHISAGEAGRLSQVLRKGAAGDDLAAAYYAARGLRLLGQALDAATIQRFCTIAEKSLQQGDVSAETAFTALSVNDALACKGKSASDALIKNLKAILDSPGSSVADIRYAGESLSLLKQSVPGQAKVAQTIKNRLKEDDSLSNVGQALHAASFLGGAGKFIQDHVEDVIAQADEIDGKLLQWEGGLSISSLLITGLLRQAGNKPFTQNQADKVASYLLTRRTVQTPKGALALLEAVEALSSSVLPPVSISLVGPSYVSADKPLLKVLVSDLLGRPLKSSPGPVVAQSTTRLTDDVVVLSKQSLTAGSVPGEYTLPLRLEPGQYRIDLTAGTHSTVITVRILGPVSVTSFQIGLTDSDGTSQPQLIKVEPSGKLASPLKADSSHHLIAKFTLSRPVHQAFLRLSSGKREILFVGEKDNSQGYKVQVDLASGYSGSFEIELIVGDAVASNPLRWSVGAIEVSSGSAGSPAKKQLRVPKPEIQHLFRPAEKRPPEMVSLVFSALTAAPLLLLLGLWWKLGANLGNFTLISIPFHLGFGAILALFVCFWLHLDMFQTCAWLVLIGGFTFFSGQKLLSHIARHKK